MQVDLRHPLCACSQGRRSLMVALNWYACRRGGVCRHDACIGKCGCDGCLISSSGSQNDEEFVAEQLVLTVWRFLYILQSEQDEWWHDVSLEVWGQTQILINPLHQSSSPGNFTHFRDIQTHNTEKDQHNHGVLRCQQGATWMPQWGWAGPLQCNHGDI